MVRRPAAVTISDVAARAGVSLSTVSRALNGNATVDPALAERVRAAAAELDYTANPVARSLVSGRTQTVAVVVPDLANPTFQAILRGLGRAASADDFHVLVSDSVESIDAERTLATTTRRRTDGVILCAPRMPQPELDALAPTLSPLVLVNRVSPDVPSVRADYGAALRTQLEDLHRVGHRRIVYLAGAPGSASGAQRASALDAFAAAHPEVDLRRFPGGVDADAGAAAADAVLASTATAAVAFNDLVAIGLLDAVRRRGCRVPDDLSIVGFDDIPFARFTTPPLTTATVPADDLGREAWIRMRALLAGEAVPRSLTVIPQSVRRETVGDPQR